MATHRFKAIFTAAALAWMVGCTTAAPERDASVPGVEDRPVPGQEGAAGPGTDVTTGALPDTGGVEGDPLRDSGGPALTMVIYFDFDSNEVHPDDQVVVEAHAQFLTREGNAEVVLEGHADERGSREYNVALGERRANTVGDMLRLLGVSDHQIRTVSYGEERPAALGHAEESWSRNRRVEFSYVPR